MLIAVFDQLLSGRRIHKIAFADGEGVAREGLKVDFQDGVENADAWVCWDQKGIWFSYNADVYTPDGYLGKQGREDPLSSIKAISFMPE
jgi:hypothetical protein